MSSVTFNCATAIDQGFRFVFAAGGGGHAGESPGVLPEFLHHHHYHQHQHDHRQAPRPATCSVAFRIYTLRGQRPRGILMSIIRLML